MAKSKLTKFRFPPAKILRFNQLAKLHLTCRAKTDINREIVESVMLGLAR